MARTKRWKESSLANGLYEVQISSWKYFSDYINQEMLIYTDYVYRGHGNSTWKLEPTLDRIIKNPTSKKRKEHLDAFQYRARGRRGPNPPVINEENDWWALGQHHGLVTPLLDWTESPFVALYFAASDAVKEKSKKFSVFGLWQNGVDQINRSVMKNVDIKKIDGRKPIVKIVRPFSDENNRLVSQRGLFTRGPNNIDLESWAKKFNNLGTIEKTILILKMTMPSTGLKNCLRYLNRMNINHSTLFPDLTGASEYCNRLFTIKNY